MVEKFLEIVKFMVEHWSEIVSYIVAGFTALIGLFMLIPGDQPEKFMKSVVDFLSKFSKKPSA